ncbi:hypothetical protein Fmac_012368 [Flemingia macrophylla]|uniref:Lipoxygenase n=1 Tax=Flemingia macrophylla TaxID=520843 RepID=A0ABD1MQX2_9FABA
MFGMFDRGHKIKGTVVLMSKNVLDFNEIVSTTRGGVTGAARGVINTAAGIVGGVVDAATAIFSRNISLQLISATKTDGLGHGKLGKQTFLEKHLPTLPTLGDRQDAFNIYFDWDESFGIPGAFYIKNFMQSEFFLLSVKLEDIPNHGTINFVCNSWVYNAKCYKRDRIFFANKAYLPDETPDPLVKYRKEELENLRGEGKGERKEYDRIYDYEVYNDLGNPDQSKDLSRPTLGGSSKYPYPRRGRTGRKPTRKEPDSETPTSNTYIPRDENFGHLKSSDFLTYGIKSLTQNVLPQFQSAFGLNAEFDSFEDVRCLFEGGLFLPTDAISKISPIPVIKEIFRTDGEQFLKFPPPHVIRVSKSAWMTDEEFGREMLAGVNPGLIQCLQEFPPTSKLDARDFGDQTSRITKEQLEINLGGLTVEQALNGKRLFTLDHHDAFMSYLEEINNLPTAKSYATRTILFLNDDRTLKPLAIELSLPHPRGKKFGAISRVILPAEADQGAEGTIWLLAKAYVVVNDSGYHQLISHWLNTHATIEPFVIATNRNLSVLHPIYKLLLPHYRDTMNINALARQSLINAGGIIEQSFLPGRFSLEMSSAVYKGWVFTDQALPADLIKRGMAVEDPSFPNGLRLVIEDYPYAVDGLEIWNAIKTWVQDYVSVYYATDGAVKNDSELQAWWKEAVEKGHGDLKDKPWWPKLQTIEEMIQTCSIIIWIASALHAAVNFGQYPYGGYILNRPTLTRRLLPEAGSKEYEECGKDPQKAYLRTITAKYQALVDLSVIEILSRHASDEIYLGQRDNNDWTDERKAKEAFEKFGKKLKDIEAKISERNKDPSLRNRNGPAQMPYTVLLPTSKEGLTFSGIPNSISI